MRPTQIILATDFSPASAAAGTIATTMAQLFECPIVIVHVFQYAAQHRYIMPVEWMINTIRSDVQEQMQKAQQSLVDRGIEARTLLIEDGIPNAELLKAAQAYTAPMIVMGTHAVAGLDRFLLGSTAESVLREATCPVITVGPHVQWVEHTGSLRRLLFATDFSQESLGAVPTVRMLRLAAAASLFVLHVQTDHAAETSNQGARRDSFLKELGGSDVTTDHPDTKFLTLHGAAVAQAICNEAEILSADLLVLGVRHGSAFTTHLGAKTAFQVIAAAPCAVLTLSF